MSSDEIRQRCYATMQKIVSLRVAVNERRHQFNEVTSTTGCRPKTAFMRTPAYLTRLHDHLLNCIVDLRQIFERGVKARFFAASERIQIRSLIADLERELALIDDTFDLCKIPLAIRSSDLPSISASNTDGNSEETNGELNENNLPSLSTAVLDSVEKEATVQPPEVYRPRRTKTMLLRMQLTREPTAVLKSNQSYPYDSSFPKLEPIVRKRYKKWVGASTGSSDLQMSKMVESYNRYISKRTSVERKGHRTSWPQ